MWCPSPRRAAPSLPPLTRRFGILALEEIRADAGLDIGGTLIGMHLKKVAVPVRLEQDHIGQAIVLAARVRPKFIGGDRAVYDETLKEGYPDFTD